MDPVTAGVLGCGTISDAYLDANGRFDSYDVVACADIDEERTRAKAAEFGIEARRPEELLADDEIELVVNLTPPSVHAETCEELLAAGKHVYVEKPLAASGAEADSMLERAAEEGLLLGSAPDTFLGAGLQTCRSVVDEGRIGEPVGATAVCASGGPESWHPNPDIFYSEGGGPLFDMGPYYLTALVALLGPARRVTGATSRAFEVRTATSEARHGDSIDVEVPTHETGLVDFAGGSTATIVASFDVPGGSTLSRPAFEMYGTEGTLKLPDPNRFDGPVLLRPTGADEPEEIPLTHRYTAGRGAGVADLARAIRTDWTHRTNGALARHVLAVLEGIRDASESGKHVPIEVGAERPEPLPRMFPDEQSA